MGENKPWPCYTNTEHDFGPGWSSAKWGVSFRQTAGGRYFKVPGTEPGGSGDVGCCSRPSYSAHWSIDAWMFTTRTYLTWSSWISHTVNCFWWSNWDLDNKALDPNLYNSSVGTNELSLDSPNLGSLPCFTRSLGTCYYHGNPHYQTTMWHGEPKFTYITYLSHEIIITFFIFISSVCV